MPLDLPIFSVHHKLRRDRKPAWEASVYMSKRIYAREAGDAEGARRLLACLKKALVSRPGPTVPVVEAWERGGFCGTRR